MKHRILSAIGVILGGAIVLSNLMNGSPEGSGTYTQGQVGGLIFGIVLFGAGLYYLIKGGKQSSPEKGRV